MQVKAPWDIPAIALLAPVLALQGLNARKRAGSLPEPEGPRRGAAGQGRLIRVLILGDSSAAGVGVPTQDLALSGRLEHHVARAARIEWRLIARCGALSRDVAGWLELETPEPFDWVVIGLGLNDVTRGVPLARWMAQHRSIRARLRDRWGDPRIILSGLPPVGRFPLLPQPLRATVGMRADRFDRRRMDWADSDPGLYNLAFDGTLEPHMMAEDGYHPGPRIYDRWAELAAGIILRETA